MACKTKIKPPFPYFGGKSKIAKSIWSRFGDTRNYVDPFFGSGAVLFWRPHWPWKGNRIETINDVDCYLSNFWRAVQADPEAVAMWCDWPVNEADMHARHLWLVNVGCKHVKRLRTDPDYYDVKIAGWWVWGISQWIGDGWCDKQQNLGENKGIRRPRQKVPEIGEGRGVHRPKIQLVSYFAEIAERLRNVRVCCGDWSRVVGRYSTTSLGLTSIILDPPYTAKAGRDKRLFAVEDDSVGYVVRDWAIEHGNDPLLRIAFCGYEGEYVMPDDWECLAWKNTGGMGKGRGLANRHRERVWFSPHCLKNRRGLLF